MFCNLHNTCSIIPKEKLAKTWLNYVKENENFTIRSGFRYLDLTIFRRLLNDTL